MRTAPWAPDGFGHGYHIYPVRVPQRRQVYEHLHENGVAVQVHYVPIHRHPLYAGLVEFPATDQAYEGLLSLPMYPALSDADQDPPLRINARPKTSSVRPYDPFWSH